MKLQEYTQPNTIQNWPNSWSIIHISNEIFNKNVEILMEWFFWEIKVIICLEPLTCTARALNWLRWKEKVTRKKFDYKKKSFKLYINRRTYF